MIFWPEFAYCLKYVTIYWGCMYVYMQLNLCPVSKFFLQILPHATCIYLCIAISHLVNCANVKDCFVLLFQIPEQFRFMSQHPVKKKHRHKKHKGQDSEKNKDGGEAINQGNRLLDQDKPASSTAGMYSLLCSFGS